MAARRHGALVIAMLAAVLLMAAPADAARTANGPAERALFRAAAAFEADDALAMTRSGRFVERMYWGATRRFRLNGAWISALDRRWGRVIAHSVDNNRISTVLRRRGGRWRALASADYGGPDADRRDAVQCRRSRIPRLVAVDLGLGLDNAPRNLTRCQGKASTHRRGLSRAQLSRLIPAAISRDWPAPRDDLGDCLAREPVSGEGPSGYASRSMPVWRFVDVYCTQGTVNGLPQGGAFAAVFRGNHPVERLSISTAYLGTRCWNGRGLRAVPLRARLELGLCTPMPVGLYAAIR